jgi:hypothetical protein
MYHVDKFKREIDRVWLKAKQELMHRGGLLNRLFVFDASGKRMPLPIEPAGEAGSIVPIVGAALQQFKGIALILIVEAWMGRTDGMRPSADPERQAVISLFAIHPEHREQRVLSFEQDVYGRTHVGVGDILTGGEVKGALVDLFDNGLRGRRADTDDAEWQLPQHGEKLRLIIFAALDIGDNPPGFLLGFEIVPSRLFEREATVLSTGFDETCTTLGRPVRWQEGKRGLKIVNWSTFRARLSEVRALFSKAPKWQLQDALEERGRSDDASDLN